ncbi:MAG: XTP/dITP diphosphatase [Candidatus Bathyarchaeota archaeon]|nr:XTP/dITP diphosphatase [Candidatus Bathyarchaeota archaeon]
MLRNAGSNGLLGGKVVLFATGNVNKFNEARAILGAYGVSVGMLRLKGDEIQSDSLMEIAQKSVRYAYGRCGLPIFVEDAGLFIDALGGFPGPYAAYAYRTIHNSGILKLMEDKADRNATFRSVISYLDGSVPCQPKSFLGESRGTITVAERREAGKSGFGFDPIFQPEGSRKTFAEMTIGEKNGFSHRACALRRFAEWYQTHVASEAASSAVE